MTRGIFAATVIIAVTLLVPAAAHADVITATCTAAGVTAPCSSGWYTADVTVSFILPQGSSNPLGCSNQTLTSDTPGTTITCTVAVTGSQCCRLDIPLKRDATPPTAAAIAADRGADVNGWYNHPVGVSVSGSDATSGLASCTSVSYAGPDSGAATVTGSCRDNAGNTSGTQTLTLKYDGTAPSVSGAPARGPDANGWYNHAVDVAFKGTDAASGIDSCTSGSYSGPDNGSAGVAGTCRDAAGNTGSATFSLRFDGTAPAVSGASADRQPDVGGWYNHPVVVTFAGADSTSGIATCDAVTYAKPDDPKADVGGQCRDAAGNVSAPGSFALAYDSTPPKVSDLAVAAADDAVSLKWKASKDVAHLTIVRAGGSGGTATVYDGRATSGFVDKKLRNGIHYTYTVTGIDAAGNRAVEKVAAAPAPPLLAPRQEAHVRGGVALRWRPVAKASYYNVQLWLKGKKVLTTWPTGPRLQLPRSWLFAGRTVRLVPGHYVWHVWPGFGSRAKHRFGPLVGTSTFVVTG